MDGTRFIAEVMRIAAAVVPNIPMPAGGVIGAGLNAAANRIDQEDDESTASSTRKIKQKRRETWIKFAVKLEKEKQRALAKAGDGVTEGLRTALNNRAAAELRAVITGDIWETEEREAGGQEVNLYAEAVSARARQQL